MASECLRLSSCCFVFFSDVNILFVHLCDCDMQTMKEVIHGSDVSEDDVRQTQFSHFSSSASGSTFEHSGDDQSSSAASASDTHQSDDGLVTAWIQQISYSGEEVEDVEEQRTAVEFVVPPKPSSVASQSAANRIPPRQALAVPSSSHLRPTMSLSVPSGGADRRMSTYSKQSASKSTTGRSQSQMRKS